MRSSQLERSEPIQELREAWQRVSGYEIQAFGESVPRYKIDKQGSVHVNPDYIAPALQPEPAQYEQALVSYELC